MLVGAAGALFHLWIVRHRTHLAVRGRSRLALASYPVELLAIAVGVLSAVWIGPVAAWATFVGVLVARLVVVVTRQRT